MNSAYIKMQRRRALRRDLVGGVMILAAWWLWGWLLFTVAQP